MQNDLYTITCQWTEDFTDVTLRLSESEVAAIERVFDGMFRGKNLDYPPTITIINVSAMQREQELKKKEAEAKAERERLEDIRNNGAMAVAFRRAQEKKNKK